MPVAIRESRQMQAFSWACIWKEKMIDINEIKAKFSYDAKTGIVFKIKPNGEKVRASFLCSRQGRNRVSFKSKKMYAYRVAWLLHHGMWPSGEIDHINGDHSDDRLCNLRDVSRSQNQENIRRPTSRNRLGVLGVSKNKDRYSASIKTHGAVRHLGSYKTAEDAHEAYLQAKRSLHAGCTL